MKSEIDEAAAAAALKIFRGEPATLQELLHLGAIHQRANRLDDARRLFENALLYHRKEMTDGAAIKLVRDLIVCTYKDPDLPADTRLSAAEQMLLGILGKPPSSDATQLQSMVNSLAISLDEYPDLKQDLLGIAGAVEKRRWEIYGLRMHLVRAYQYYLQGYEMGSARDQGYNGVNLAFVLDLLSKQEEGELDQGKAARDMASEVRKEIIATLDPSDAAEADENKSKPESNDEAASWWLLVTLGEAYLGIGSYEHAVQRLTQASAVKSKLEKEEDESKRIAPWQFETTARQLVRVAQIQAEREGGPGKAVENTASWRAIEALLGQDSKAAQSFLHGKIGLALSGGGFRASLFHIGVLAKLAELDVLRHIEVLSCVSGGSILGAYYYLELRNVLQTCTDDKICRQDYIDLVERVRQGFLAGVQRNIRLRMLMGWPSNWRVLTTKRSSSSNRLALLYESELYSKVQDGEQNRPRYLADLKVTPLVWAKDEKGQVSCAPATGFNPRYENWGRVNKIPAMILNSTSLNTCHNWQFTTSFMGEPPARSIDAEIDANHRMRRMYHWEAPRPYRRPDAHGKGTTGIRLGEAVAASACVPGLFDPLLLEDLYGELGKEKAKYLKQLVDGGNYDNQGVASLREQDCSVLIVSDACGQTGISVDPASDHLGVMMRANNILMARGREVQYQLLSTLEDSGALRGMMYLHLKKGLEAQVIDWVDCKDPSTISEPKPTTEYGVREDVQRLLAAVRTDLDSFSWLESDALMLSGYLMAGSEWPKCLQSIPSSLKPPVSWEFQKLQAAMTADKEEAGGETLRYLKKGLGVAEELAFKPFKLYPLLKVGGIIIVLLLAAPVVWWVAAHWASSISDLGKTITMGLGGLILLIAAREFILVRTLNYRNSYLQILGALFMCILGWIVFYPYLLLIDPLYVNWGSGYRRK
jgi:predicted acylesterase/phospholipase RssA